MIDISTKHYAGFMPNDLIDGKNISVSFWTQGCPFHCKGCHNPESWDFNAGYKVPEDIYERIKEAIFANGIMRNFSVLGGEPMCDENIELTHDIVHFVRSLSEDIKIFLWSGYTHKELVKRSKDNDLIKEILRDINYLIDGQFEEENMSRTLYLRGSTNQKIIENPGEF